MRNLTIFYLILTILVLFSASGCMTRVDGPVLKYAAPEPAAVATPFSTYKFLPTPVAQANLTLSDSIVPALVKHGLQPGPAISCQNDVSQSCVQYTASDSNFLVTLHEDGWIEFSFTQGNDVETALLYNILNETWGQPMTASFIDLSQRTPFVSGIYDTAGTRRISVESNPVFNLLIVTISPPGTLTAFPGIGGQRYKDAQTN
jgi:hypothetical protein